MEQLAHRMVSQTELKSFNIAAPDDRESTLEDWHTDREQFVFNSFDKYSSMLVRSLYRYI